MSTNDLRGTVPGVGSIDGRFVAVTMTREETVSLTLEELRILVGRPDASEELLRSLVEDTDVHHAALSQCLSDRKGEVFVSFQVRPR